MKLNAKELQRLAQERFDRIYSVNDIVKGDTIAMFSECVQWVMVNYHRDALFNYLMMEAIACEGRDEIDDMEENMTAYVWDNHNEVSAELELERLLK